MTGQRRPAWRNTKGSWGRQHLRPRCLAAGSRHAADASRGSFPRSWEIEQRSVWLPARVRRGRHRGQRAGQGRSVHTDAGKAARWRDVLSGEPFKTGLPAARGGGGTSLVAGSRRVWGWARGDATPGDSDSQRGPPEARGRRRPRRLFADEAGSHGEGRTMPSLSNRATVGYGDSMGRPTGSQRGGSSPGQGPFGVRGWTRFGKESHVRRTES